MALVLALFALLLQDDYVAEAIKALKANQPALAEDLSRKAIAADKKDFEAHFNLALALSMQQKDGEAVTEYRTTLELKPGLYQANLNLGLLLMRQKHAAEAIPLLKEAAEARPKEARPNLYYAQAALETGDFATAEQHFHIAAEADPKNAAAQFGLGQTQLKQGKLDDAAASYRAAAANDPAYKNAILDLAGEYERAKQPEKAIDIYQQFPQNAAAQQRLGELLLDNKQFAAAIPKLEQAVKSAPTADNYLALGIAYKRNKQPEKAVEQFKAAVERDSTNYELRMTYGRELRDLRQFVPASQQFMAAANQRPDSVEAWNELASVLIISENYGPGLAALDRVKALGKESPGNYYLRAITLDKLKQLKPALESYQQFLAADNGKLPEEEFKARQRSRIIENELKKR